MFICDDCGSVLTDEERHYYGRRCEACVQEWSRQITLWMKGGENAELDALYSIPPETQH